MAPTPANDDPPASPTPSPQPIAGYWTKVNIALTTVFALLALGIFLALLLFFLYRRSQRKKYAKPHADKASLLNNEDKGSMFSRTRHSSVTLYVDSEADAQSKRVSQETMSLIPLHVTPAEESRHPLNINTGSTGTGLSAASRSSRTTNTNTLSSTMLSPVSPGGEEGDLGIRPTGRPRSTSSASQRARYYSGTPTNVEMPPIPKIIHTTSDGELR